MGLKHSRGNPLSCNSSADKIKNSLLPVARPRLILKNSAMVGASDCRRTLASGKRVHFLSCARAFAETILLSFGSANVPPKVKVTGLSFGGATLRNQTIADETSASAN